MGVGSCNYESQAAPYRFYITWRNRISVSICLLNLGNQGSRWDNSHSTEDLGRCGNWSLGSLKIQRSEDREVQVKTKLKPVTPIVLLVLLDGLQSVLWSLDRLTSRDLIDSAYFCLKTLHQTHPAPSTHPYWLRSLSTYTNYPIEYVHPFQSYLPELLAHEQWADSLSQCLVYFLLSFSASPLVPPLLLVPLCKCILPCLASLTFQDSCVSAIPVPELLIFLWKYSELFFTYVFSPLVLFSEASKP